MNTGHRGMAPASASARAASRPMRFATRSPRLAISSCTTSLIPSGSAIRVAVALRSWPRNRCNGYQRHPCPHWTRPVAITVGIAGLTMVGAILFLLGTSLLLPLRPACLRARALSFSRFRTW